MSRVIIIAVAEFEQAVRSRAFLIGLLAVPLLMALAFGIQALTARRDTSERHFAIVDRTGVLARRSSRRRVSTTPRRPRRRAAGPDRRSCRRSSPTRARRPRRRAWRCPIGCGADELFAFVEIPAEVLTASGGDEPRLQYYTRVPDLSGAARLAAARGEPRRRRPAAVARSAPTRRRRGACSSRCRWTARAWWCATADGTVSEAEKVDAVRAFAMPAIAMFMLFGLVMSSAPQLLNSVIEEKTSRISEVLLGSVSAFHLMLGKLLGSVGGDDGAGVIYIGGGLLLAAQADYFGLIRWSLIPWFALFLVIAVFLYGAMFIAIGAACSEVKDAQGMMMPALILAMFPIFLWLQVAQNPDSAMSVRLLAVPVRRRRT